MDANWQAAKQKFNRDGFAVIKNFFPADEKQHWLDQLQRYIDEIVPTVDPKLVYYEDKDRPETLLRAERMNEHDPYFKSLCEEGPFRTLAELMLEGKVIPKHLDIMGKAPQIGPETPPHQDAYYWMIEPNDALTLWVAIDRADEENGCVRYVRGTHRKGIRPHAKSKLFGFSQAITDYGDEDERYAEPVCVDTGDVIAHHCVTVHRADPNKSPRMRRAMRIVYYGAHVKADQARNQAYTRQLKKEWAEAGKL